jgi:hypothetical protein
MATAPAPGKASGTVTMIDCGVIRVVQPIEWRSAVADGSVETVATS